MVVMCGEYVQLPVPYRMYTFYVDKRSDMIF